jgi:hypothetical protein
MALKAGDHLGTGVLIGPYHRTQVFGIELAGESRRIHQITEEDRELTAFGLRRGGHRWRGDVRRRRRRWLKRGEGPCVARPDEDTPVFIPRDLLRVEEFVFQDFQLGIRQPTLELQGTIGNAAPLAQEGHDLIHDR